MKYNSKIDAYNFITLLVVIVALALPNFFFEFSWAYFGIMLAIDLILVLFMFLLCYELKEDKLVVKFGFIKFGVSYERITKIELMSNYIISSCAMSAKQIKITFGAGFVVRIAPENEEVFLKNLKEKCVNVSEIKNKRKQKNETLSK